MSFSARAPISPSLLSTIKSQLLSYPDCRPTPPGFKRRPFSHFSPTRISSLCFDLLQMSRQQNPANLIVYILYVYINIYATHTHTYTFLYNMEHSRNGIFSLGMVLLSYLPLSQRNGTTAHMLAALAEHCTSPFVKPSVFFFPLLLPPSTVSLSSPSWSGISRSCIIH